ncbi:MAG: L,D-transpeptidase family protein [Phycisphaerales bacterium]|nr:L,D-transpeptidase family protein [Phycisphaerales bacterium]
MALPSQAARTTRYRARSSRGMRRRRRGGGGGGKKVFALIVFAALVVVVWWNWPEGKGAPSSADAGDGTGPGRIGERNGAVETRVSGQTPTGSRSEQPNPAAGRIPQVPADDEKSVPVKPGPGEQSSPRELKLTDVERSTPERTPVVREPDPRPASTPPATGRASALEILVTAGGEAYDRGALVQARDLWNRALHHPTTTAQDQEVLRQRLTEINDALIFSQQVAEGDPITGRYTVQSGDSMSRIVSRQGLSVDYRLIARLNKIADVTKIRPGQTLKTVKGPFHAIISKSDYRLDLYADATDADGKWLYIRSYPVGLGEDNGTPYGTWHVVASRRLIDPEWVNPRTGEKFAASDEANPIGERWVPLEGTDEITSQLSGYGIHGTIDRDSIGKQRSMGCVRMLPEDVEWIYEFLSEDECQVTIVP